MKERRVRRAAGVVTVCLASALSAPPAAASAPCGRAVIFTMPGVTWASVRAHDPPNLLEAVGEGAAGSLSVRTLAERTSYASAYLTIGAGTRAEGGDATGRAARITGGPVSGGRQEPEPVRVDDFPVLRRLAEAGEYRALPGALGGATDGLTGAALGNADVALPPTSLTELGRWTHLAAMDTEGVVDLAGTGPGLLRVDPGFAFGIRTSLPALEEATRAALARDCSLTVIDPGDLTRSDRAASPGGEHRSFGPALMAADRLLGRVRELLGPEDLLLVVAPTSPAWDHDVHLTVAVALGPGFAPGSVLTSASTRAGGLVTLPDVGPTVLAHLGIEPPTAMVGRPFRGAGDALDPVAEGVELDEEAVFAGRTQIPVTTGFVVFQLVLCGITFSYLWRRRGDRGERLGGILQALLLFVIAFPMGSYLATPLPAARMGVAPYVLVLMAIPAVVVALVSFLSRDLLRRLQALFVASIGTIALDLVTGGRLQMNALWGNDPILGGRFSGLGNTGFTVLGVAGVMAAALLVETRGRSRRVLTLVVIIFAALVVIDGLPAWGSDVGGVLALVPALVFTFLLLAGVEVTWKRALAGVAAGVAALLVFLLFDLSRPPETRTHLARLAEDVAARGPGALEQAARRKMATFFGLFGKHPAAYPVPFVYAAVALVVVRRPPFWERFAVPFYVRRGLLGALLLGALGFALNDSGVLVLAMTLSYVVPVVLVLALDPLRPEPA